MKCFPLVNQSVILFLDFDEVSLDLFIVENPDQEPVYHGDVLEVLSTRHHNATCFKNTDCHVEHIGFHRRVRLWAIR